MAVFEHGLEDQRMHVLDIPAAMHSHAKDIGEVCVFCEQRRKLGRIVSVPGRNQTLHYLANCASRRLSFNHRFLRSFSIGIYRRARQFAG
jgi:hypothetical protein